MADAPDNTSADKHIIYSFHEVAQAVNDAIRLKRYNAIDDIIHDNINALALVSHGRTPVFYAIEQVLGETINTNVRETHIHAVGMVTSALSHMFKEMNERLGDDKELLSQAIHASCNHISHSGLLTQPAGNNPHGGTVRDLLESYTGLDLRCRPRDRGYEPLYTLVKQFGLAKYNVVAQEGAGNYPGQSGNERNWEL